MTNAPPARPAAPPRPQPPAAPPKPAAAPLRIGKANVSIPPRLVINAVEGWGKTTLAAFAPNPLIFMARNETGFNTLRGQDLVPDADCALVDDWRKLLPKLDDLAANLSGYKTIVFDALGGFERLCFEVVVARDFAGKWGEDGFASYGKGPGIAVRDWLELLPRLDAINRAGATVIVLSHAKTGKHSNPTGRDYDRYVADATKEVWAVTARWADAVLFGTFTQMLTEDKKAHKMKASDSASERVLYATRTDAWDAKNRYGMPDEIAIPDDHTQVWATLAPYLSRPQPNGETTK